MTKAVRFAGLTEDDGHWCEAVSHGVVERLGAYLYVAAPRDFRTSKVFKVGSSRNPWTRARSMSNQSPQEIVILKAYGFQREAIAYLFEGLFHDAAGSGDVRNVRWSHGEWYRYSDGWMPDADAESEDIIASVWEVLFHAAASFESHGIDWVTAVNEYRASGTAIRSRPAGPIRRCGCDELAPHGCDYAMGVAS